MSTDSRSSGEIETDIRQRRDKMDATLDELGSRLTLRSLVHSAMEWWDSPDPGKIGSMATNRAVRSLARQIKEHPMPSLLIGGGLAWLIADSEDDESESPPGRLAGATRSAGHAVGETLDHAKEAAGDALDTAKEKLADTGHALHEKGEQVVHQIHETGKTALAKARHGIADGYQASAERFGHAVEEYPLAVGVAFAALGLLAGISLPHTRKEDQWLGEKSDEVIEAAKEKGEQLLESGKAVGSRVLEAVKEGAEDQGLTGSNLAGTLSNLADKGAQVLEKAKDEAKQAAEEEGLKPKVTS